MAYSTRERLSNCLEDSGSSDRCSSDEETKAEKPRVPFEDRWLKGIGLSVWQNSSDTHSQWTEFAKQKKYFGQQHLVEAYQLSADFWNMYEFDIALAHKAGATSFRFSFEWARFEPTEGVFEQATFDRYNQILDCLEKYDMVPMCTLHHFTHPQWFERKGGFLSLTNVPLFLNYVKIVYAHFGSRIRLWGTFNEPTVFAFVGYIMGLWAPGRTLGFVEAGEVLLNLMKAHVSAYKLIKSMPGGETSLVGIVHQHILFKPKTDFFYVKSICSWMSYWFGTKTILKFFKEGRFEWKAPLRGKVLQYHEPDAPKCFDWWGINYYSRPLIDWNFKLAGTGNEPLADNDFRIHPDGMYESIKESSALGKPVYITETGIADREDALRGRMIQEYYYQVLRAINDGYDVRGTYFWTLMDNIEWHEGFRHKFGLYEFCPEQPRTPLCRLKPGSQALVAVHKAWPDTHVELKVFAAEQTKLNLDKQQAEQLIWNAKLSKKRTTKKSVRSFFSSKSSTPQKSALHMTHLGDPTLPLAQSFDNLVLPATPPQADLPGVYRRSLTAPAAELEESKA